MHRYYNYIRRLYFGLVLVVAGMSAGCGGGSGDTTVSPNNSPPPPPSTVNYTLSVSLDGAGLVEAGPNLRCGSTCSATYASGTAVTLMATPDTDYDFDAWSVNDFNCPASASCAITMTSARSVTARFKPRRYDLNVSVVGSGTVRSAPAGIDCGADCTERFQRGTSVTLTATPASGSVFSGWSGDSACTGSGTCTVSMTAARNVTATFSPVAASQYTLQVTRTGSGTVTSAPAGISCGADCSEVYNSGTSVTLSAAPASGYTFGGWSGAGCSGTGTCTVSMTAARTVSANFTVNTYALTVSVQGSGSVSSSPAGIACGADCSETYNSGTSVTLTATPASGNLFSGWSGSGISCAGTGTCTVSMTAARSVTATFSVQPSYTLTVSKTGSGTVMSSPAGINCGADCSESYTSGTSVTLSATPASGYTFGGWGGACAGVSTCTLSMTAARSASATFLSAATTRTYLLAWSAVPDARVTGYRVYYAPAAFTSPSGATMIPAGAAISYVFNPASLGITRGTTMHFAVTAITATDESALSVPVSAVME